VAEAVFDPRRWPPRLREDLEDASLRAGVAALLEALALARQERDQARREAHQLRARLDAAHRHLYRLRRWHVRPRRRTVTYDQQLPMDLEINDDSGR
jgi:hypothetical protein